MGGILNIISSKENVYEKKYMRERERERERERIYCTKNLTFN